MRGSAIRCSTNLISQDWLDFIEKALDVDLEYPVHLCAGDPDHQGVQRIVLAALGAEPIRKAEEVLLVDRTQHRGGRPLDDLVFEGGNRDWSLSAVWFWYVLSTARQCPIRSSVDPIVQVFDIAIEVCLVVLPRQAVRPGRGVLLECEERQPEQLGTDVVEKRGELFLLPLLGSLPYAFQRL